MNPLGLVLSGLSNAVGTYMGYRKGKSLAKLEEKAERKKEATMGIRDSSKYEAYVGVFFIPLGLTLTLPYIDTLIDSVITLSYSPGTLMATTNVMLTGLESMPVWYSSILVIMVSAEIMVKGIKVYKNN